MVLHAHAACTNAALCAYMVTYHGLVPGHRLGIGDSCCMTKNNSCLDRFISSLLQRNLNEVDKAMAEELLSTS